jgi:BirA family biotin operon repressor/biotin-[acetyl-CoA-carboxylase] ligase
LEESPNGILDAWRGLSSTLGRQVEVTTSPGKTVSGVAVDIDHDGALVLDVGGRRSRIVSGSLRDATVKF